MSRDASRRNLILACVAIAAAALPLAGCDDNAQAARMDETRAKLVGTWLAEAESGVVKSRRVVALSADGRFTDRVVVTTSGSVTQKVDYGGEWSYDGTNFKRRYLQENGRQYSGGRIRYATFPLVSVSPSELIVDDNVQGAKVTFRRVPEGTQP